jgi:(p)ppGpp synthase/HD superfamily hydrolase
MRGQQVRQHDGVTTSVTRLDSRRTGQAVQLAAELHAGQTRKGSEIPYLSHLMSVAALVMEDGGTQDEVIAGLLHDAAEDQGGEQVLARIEQELGAVVAGIVRECSDSITEVGVAKAPWRERKERAIELLPKRSRSALLVIAADKLHNVRSTVVDLEVVGPGVWDRFRTGRYGFVWYHELMVAGRRQRLPESRSVGLLERELARL